MVCLCQLLERPKDVQLPIVVLFPLTDNGSQGRRVIELQLLSGVLDHVDGFLPEVVCLCLLVVTLSQVYLLFLS